ncbi:hypothetical protein PWT90_10143 [Aphanocladium album]|nr:hypothetical protein PWT90_10143 [Aphanocladium album]
MAQHQGCPPSPQLSPSKWPRSYTPPCQPAVDARPDKTKESKEESKTRETCSSTRSTAAAAAAAASSSSPSSSPSIHPTYPPHPFSIRRCPPPHRQTATISNDLVDENPPFASLASPSLSLLFERPQPDANAPLPPKKLSLTSLSLSFIAQGLLIPVSHQRRGQQHHTRRLVQA